MRNHTTQIVSLSPRSWKLYRQIILEAVTLEPLTFTSILEYLEQVPQERWVKNLQNPQNTKGITLFFARKNLEVIGFIAGQLSSQIYPPGVGVIQTVYVKKAMRKQGIGGKLLVKMLSHMKKETECRKIVLSVNAANSDAIQLYKKHNFHMKSLDVQIMSNGIEQEVLLLKCDL